jgi:FixJ family two-component response regulator
MNAGAVEFLVRSFEDRVVLDAVEDALERGRTAVAAESQLRKRRLLRDALGALEKQAMGPVVSGFLNKQVAFELGTGEVTVKAHCGRAMEKMQTRPLAGLVRMNGSLGRP